MPSRFRCVRLCATLWAAARQAPPPMGFSRQEYWSGLPFPSPGDLPDPGITPGSHVYLHWQASSLPLVPPGNLVTTFQYCNTRPMTSSLTTLNSLICAICANSTNLIWLGSMKWLIYTELFEQYLTSDNCSVMSDSLWPCGLWLLCPWDSAGKNTAVGSHSLLWGSSSLRDRTHVSYTLGRFCIIWTTREAPLGQWSL